ncbi:hypothetical protein MPL3365_30754 [Mesorhizobium plurifarium]|uniref:Uncharacterized protein n=1 Tax=Mesorhizobium plurifarium TaxID=69974 RepID=A0A090GF37_MESPL|nr:hypothetical protein MPL3365_30754 [Mesorhizobium plurifarium]
MGLLAGRSTAGGVCRICRQDAGRPHRPCRGCRRGNRLPGLQQLHDRPGADLRWRLEVRGLSEWRGQCLGTALSHGISAWPQQGAISEALRSLCKRIQYLIEIPYRAGMLFRDNVIEFSRTKAPAMAARECLAAEAAALDAWHGPNLYSSFLRKNGVRPDRDQAATIGLLMGTKVLASDGSRQPRSRANRSRK